jgi:two-component sensor histidine kinase
VHDTTRGSCPPGLSGHRSECVSALAIDFRPHAGLLTQTREFVSSFCGTFVRDPDLVYRLTIAAHELLENAIKYSADGATNIRIAVRRDGDRSWVSIRAENRAEPQRIVAVRDMIRRIHEADDAFELYCKLIRASVEHETGSGLGLARICAEAACELDCAVTGDRLAVSAEAFIDQEGML